jgi:hypothetical protein
MASYRAELVRRIAEMQEDLRLWDIALTPGPHEPGCQCARASCTLARLKPLNDPVIHEALKDVGL